MKMYPFKNRLEAQLHKELIAKMVEDLILRGLSPFLLTIMFKQIRDSQKAVAAIMLDEVHRIYTTHLSRVTRNPKSGHAKLPVWIVCPDYPVGKRDKMSSVKDLFINGGRHYHVIVLHPPKCRFTENLVDHFAKHQAAYVGKDGIVDRIHVEPITDTPGKAAGYVLKSVFDQGTVEYDEILVLTGALSKAKCGRGQ